MTIASARLIWRILALSLAALAALGLAFLHLRYPLPYVYSVLVYRDADVGDIHRFPRREIAPPPQAIELPRALDGRVEQIVETHPRVESLAELIAETETTAFLVVNDGNLIEEQYGGGHDGHTPQNSFSISKSVASALVGIVVRDGDLSLERPITELLPELSQRDPRFGEITVAHLLDMRSGIRYSNEIVFPIVNSDDPLIYYHPDLESVVLERTVVEQPPGDFLYNNYNPPLLGLLLRRATGLQVGELLERDLWSPLGAEAAAGWTVDDRGFERMESGFFATARDLARFGLLYQQRGAMAGGRILPESWVSRTTTLAEAVELPRYDGRSWSYRGGWWIVPRPQGPPDFTAIGRFGQFIYVSPQYDTVVVRTGRGRGDWGDRDWTELFYHLAERL